MIRREVKALENELTLSYWQRFLLACLVGSTAFFLVVGPLPLLPSNPFWLSGSIDPTTHYLGWVFFRDNSWTFPLGLNPKYGLDISSSIVYSDSIPLIAMLFKLIKFALPTPFQYFGLWYLTCFILQAWFASLVIKVITPKISLQFLASCIVVFSPILFFRIGLHAALAGQFIILAGLYLNIRPQEGHRIFWWTILLVSSAGIHFYLLICVFGLWIADLLDRFHQGKIVAIAITKESLVVVLSIVVMAWQFGYFVSSSGIKAEGFGIYKLNLLSPLDSGGWSYLLADLPNGFDAGESFNYFGLGVLLLVPFAFTKLSQIKVLSSTCLNKFPYLIALLVFFTIFALSNSISFGSWSIAYPLPDSLINIASALRSSGRLFWPALYSIVLVTLFLIIRCYSYRIALLLLSLGLFIQIIDTSAGWLPKRQVFKQMSENQYDSPLKNPFWKAAASCYDKVIRLPIGNSLADWSVFAYYASQYHLSTNSVFIARIEDKILPSNLALTASLLEDRLDPKAIYIINDSELLNLLPKVNRKTNLLVRIDGYNVLLPAPKLCISPIPIPANTEITNAKINPKLGEKIGFTRTSEHTFQYLKSGWAYPESWGTWSSGPKANLTLSLPSNPAKTLTLEIRALINHLHPKQSVEILIDGKYQMTAIIKTPDQTQIHIPLQENSLTSPYLNLELKFPDRVQPKKIGIGDDERELAIGLISASYH